MRVRRLLAVALIAGAIVSGTVALASSVKGGKVCPSGMKTVQCPYGIICCDPPAGQNPACDCF
jgi:hypothetical protein